MTDPSATGRNKNLTILSLSLLIENDALRCEVEILCEAALTHAACAREQSNKRIAHQDHDYMTDRLANSLNGVSGALIEEVLDSLRTVLNRLALQMNIFIVTNVTNGVKLIQEKSRTLSRSVFIRC